MLDIKSEIKIKSNFTISFLIVKVQKSVRYLYMVTGKGNIELEFGKYHFNSTHYLSTMDKEALVARARLAEQAERYDDMADSMKQVTLMVQAGIDLSYFCVL